MALNSEIIVGTKLDEIRKRSDGVQLVFKDTKTRKSYVLSFKGLLLETSSPTLNKRVKDVQVNDTLGFRASSQLRSMDKDPHDYKQLFIQMEGSNENSKAELLGASPSYKISPQRKVTPAKKAASAHKTVSQRKAKIEVKSYEKNTPRKFAAKKSGK